MKLPDKITVKWVRENFDLDKERQTTTVTHGPYCVYDAMDIDRPKRREKGKRTQAIFEAQGEV